MRLEKLKDKPASEERHVGAVSEGKLKSFTAVCQTCGASTKFTVNALGFATCSNCRAQAAYRIGVA